jgi:hypothetical protein
MKRAGIVITLWCISSIASEHHTKQPQQPSTAQIAVVNFVNMMQSMIALAVNPDDKENVALQISNIFQGMGNIAVAGMRSQPLLKNYDDPEALKEHIIAGLCQEGVAEALVTYCIAHRDEMMQLLQQLSAHQVKETL